MRGGDKNVPPGIEGVMKGSALLLTCAVMLGVPASARALPVDTDFAITVMNGPDPNDGKDVGTISFKLATDLGMMGCRYSGGWNGVAPGTIGARCSLDEMKTHGHASCVANIDEAFETLLVKQAGVDCQGIDGFGQLRALFLLVGAESTEPAAFIGLLQWTAAAPFVSAFAAQEAP
jgi:hypothetical protein